MKSTLLLSLLVTAGEWNLQPTDPWDVQPSAQAVAWSVAPEPVPIAKPAEPPEVLHGIPRPYPLRNNFWTVGSIAPNNCPAATVAAHLLSGQHKGQFTAADLANRSWQELHSMHSDHHEGRLKMTASPVKPTPQPVRMAAACYQPVRYASNCPGGVCPIRRRR